MCGYTYSDVPDQGRLKDGEQLAITVLGLLDGRKHVLGEDHPRTIESQAVLASIYRGQCKYGKAEKVHFASLEGGRGSEEHASRNCQLTEY